MKLRLYKSTGIAHSLDRWYTTERTRRKVFLCSLDSPEPYVLTSNPLIGIDCSRLELRLNSLSVMSDPGTIPA